jgi:O-acetyl-ADP-ribose deacetylase (regulator of RNase III)
MIEIRRADITTLDVDAIVNAANTHLARGGGVCGAIYAAAGPALERLTRGMPPCPTGEAVLTPGFDLPARFIIHAVGPVWSGGDAGEPELLRAAYQNAFRVAREEGTIRSIAFPAISTGIYGFPKQRAAEIAVAVMHEHEREFARIIACLFDEESVSLYKAELQRVTRT